jgi:quinohemoprotein amine dehydrogenase beta subunit
MNRLIATLALALVTVGCQTTKPREPLRDYIVTTAKPDRLFVIDAQKRHIVSDFSIPGANNWTGTIATAQAGHVAYVLVNKMESIAGIDLRTGQQVFRADLSSGNERVKSIYGINVTPDGRHLIVYEMPTKIGLNEYMVQDPRFSIFDTRAGLSAKPVRSFPAPRRVHLLLPRPDNKSFYALGFQLYEYSLEDGKMLGERGFRDWDRPGYSIPDLVHFWPVTEPTNIFSAAVTALRGSGDSAVMRTSLMTLDTVSGAVNYQDFEDTSAIIFTTIVSPRKGEAFAVFKELTKIDTERGEVVKRVDLPHSFYTVNLATDGSEVFIGGATCHIGFYDPDTLNQRAVVKLPGCPDQSNTSLRVVRM